MRCRVWWRLLLASAPFVAGCAPGTGAYDRPGLTYAEWKRDDAECRHAAGEGERGGIDREAYKRCLSARGYRLRAE